MGQKKHQNTQLTAGFTACRKETLRLRISFDLFSPCGHTVLCNIIIIMCLLLLNEGVWWARIAVRTAVLPLSSSFPYVSRSVPSVCHSELRTAGWEVGCTLGAHEASQDQAAEKRKTFLCIHEYHFSAREREKRTKPEVNGFSISSRLPLSLLRPLVAARDQNKQNKWL